MRVAEREHAIAAREIEICFPRVIPDRAALRPNLNRRARELHHARERRIDETLCSSRTPRRRALAASRLRRDPAAARSSLRPCELCSHAATSGMDSRRAIVSSMTPMVPARIVDAHDALAQGGGAGNSLEIEGDVLAHLRHGARFAEFVDHRSGSGRSQSAGDLRAQATAGRGRPSIRSQICEMSHGLPSVARPSMIASTPLSRMRSIATCASSRSPLPMTGMSMARLSAAMCSQSAFAAIELLGGARVQRYRRNCPLPARGCATSR